METHPKRRLRTVLVPAGIALAALAIAVTTANVASASKPDDGLDRVREATAQFRDVSEAERAQYGKLVDLDGIACIDMPGLGGMGVPYVNQQLVGDGVIDALTPEAVVYQPDGQGKPRLNAVEYVVIQEQWDATHDDPPALFGHTFDLTPAGNRFGLPAFYSLHAWAFKHNPAGTFSMWNPDVTCHALNH
jgi:hypothetical protein